MLTPILSVSLPHSQIDISTPVHNFGDREPQIVETIGSGDLSGDHLVSRYIIEPVPKRPSGSSVCLPSFLPIHLDTYPFYDIASGRAFSSADSGDCRLLFWEDGEERQVCISVTRMVACNVIQRRSGILYGSYQVCHDFCPMSGRLCVLGDDRREIRIIDYVSLPPY